jgi:hypothetical protein
MEGKYRMKVQKLLAFTGNRMTTESKGTDNFIVNKGEM